MRGCRRLRASDRPGRVAALKEALTVTPLGAGGRCESVLLFGAAAADAENVTRQYLLARVAGWSLNRVLLAALADPGTRVVHPLPSAWRNVLREHGFEVAELRSRILWIGYLAMLLAFGAFSVARRVAESAARAPARPPPGKYVFFHGLSRGNLPRPCSDGKSHDVISWYARSRFAPGATDSLCHDVRGVGDTSVLGIPVLSVAAAVPPLAGARAVLRFLGWSAAAMSRALLDLLRGRWAAAVMLGEATRSAVVRLQDQHALAQEYLFHNSGWIYRPLWTYDAAARGSRIVFYFYSTNCEPFKRVTGYPAVPYGWCTMTWPRYFVWNELQAEFVRRVVGRNVRIEVVGAIWFHSSATELPKLPPRSVAVFDVQPVRASLYNEFALDFDYYTPETAVAFLSDVHAAMEVVDGTLVHKRKRKIDSLAHPSYRHFVDAQSSAPRFLSIDSDTSAVRVIESCDAVISMPFTSTALLGRLLGKPSVYYDPHGKCQKDDRAAYGIPILCGADELRAWLSSLVKGDSDSRILMASSTRKSTIESSAGERFHETVESTSMSAPADAERRR
jgi:polysaccharide biosynthesis PFTS motif protein